MSFENIRAAYLHAGCAHIGEFRKMFNYDSYKQKRYVEDYLAKVASGEITSKKAVVDKSSTTANMIAAAKEVSKPIVQNNEVTDTVRQKVESTLLQLSQQPKDTAQPAQRIRLQKQLTRASRKSKYAYQSAERSVKRIDFSSALEAYLTDLYSSIETHSKMLNTVSSSVERAKLSSKIKTLCARLAEVHDDKSAIRQNLEKHCKTYTAFCGQPVMIGFDDDLNCVYVINMKTYKLLKTSFKSSGELISLLDDLGRVHYTTILTLRTHVEKLENIL